jgi:hypothetical protein
MEMDGGKLKNYLFNNEFFLYLDYGMEMMDDGDMMDDDGNPYGMED